MSGDVEADPPESEGNRGGRSGQATSWRLVLMAMIKGVRVLRCRGVGGHAVRVPRKTVEHVVERCRVAPPTTAHKRPDTYSYRADVVGREPERPPTVVEAGSKGARRVSMFDFPFHKYDTMKRRSAPSRAAASAGRLVRPGPSVPGA